MSNLLFCFNSWSSFWQSYHSLSSYTWFKPILTSLWSSYLVWNNFNQQSHLDYCSKRWLEVLFDNDIIHCHVTRGLSLFWHRYDPPIWFDLTNKLILIFVLRDGLKFFLTIIKLTAIQHVVWAYFDTIMILLSCLNNLNPQTHLNFCSKRWLEVLFDNDIIHCHVTRGLSLFWHRYDPPIWFDLTNKLILIFVLRDGLKFFLTIIKLTAIQHVVWAYFDTIMILLSCLNNLNPQTHLNFCSKRWLEILLTIILFTAILHLVWAYFDTVMILLSCLNNFNQHTNLNLCSKRWLEVLFDNYIIYCHLTCGLSLFWHHYDPAILFEQF